MWNILSLVFGTVAINRLRLKMGNTKRNPLVALAKQFFDNYIVEWKSQGDVGKFFLIVLPLTNLFLLSGPISFILVLAIDFCLVRYILSK